MLIPDPHGRIRCAPYDTCIANASTAATAAARRLGHGPYIGMVQVHRDKVGKIMASSGRGLERRPSSCSVGPRDCARAWLNNKAWPYERRPRNRLSSLIPQIKRERRAGGARQTDFKPTLLGLLGLPQMAR
jgi:hypothetical protein